MNFKLILIMDLQLLQVKLEQENLFLLGGLSLILGKRADLSQC